jgi:hypothetical protein
MLDKNLTEGVKPYLLCLDKNKLHVQLIWCQYWLVTGNFVTAVDNL